MSCFVHIMKNIRIEFNSTVLQLFVVVVFWLFVSFLFYMCMILCVFVVNVMFCAYYEKYMNRV